MQHDCKQVSPIGILVADNSPFHTQLLVGVLSRETGFSVVSSDLETSSLVSMAISQKIDVFVLGASVDEDAERGFRVLRELKEARPSSRAVILLDSSKAESVLEAFRAGARGVFDHRESSEMLCQCIRQVHDGHVWVNDEQMSLVVESMTSGPTLKAVDAKGVNLLSNREAEVVRCVTEGLTNREIADRLGLSQHTIKNHLFRIFDKLGVSNRIELLFVTMSQSIKAPNRDLQLPALLGDPCGDCDEATLAVCEKAAEHGVLAAQLMLARTALAGAPGDHNAARAYVWFSTAINQLARFRDKAKKAMTPAQLAEAEDEVHELLGKWHSQQPHSSQASSPYQRRVVA